MAVIDVLGQEISVGDLVAFHDESRVIIVGKIDKIVSIMRLTIRIPKRTYSRSYFDVIKVTDDMVVRPSIRKEIGLD